MAGSRPGEEENDSDEADLSLSSIGIIDEPMTNLGIFDRLNGGSAEIRSVIKRSFNYTGQTSKNQSIVTNNTIAKKFGEQRDRGQFLGSEQEISKSITVDESRLESDD